MNTGGLNKILTFYPLTIAEGTDGFHTQTAGTGVAIRGKLKMLSGYRKMVYTELVNQEVYEFECFANAAVTKNSYAVYGSKTLYVNSLYDGDDTSHTSTKKLILHTK